MVAVLDKEAIRDRFDKKMAAMMAENQEIFVEVMQEYIEDIGMAYAMLKSDPNQLSSHDEVMAVLNSVTEEE